MQSVVLRSFIHLAAAAAVVLTAAAPAFAGSIHFDTDPFAGSTAPTTPGRQIVGGEPSITFDISADVFGFGLDAFGLSALSFANETIENLPASGINVIVLRTFDNDANPATPFGAGNAANLIADRITTAGAGFFVYFNSGLDLPRLVFSADLSDASADLKILARLINLKGADGRDAMADFTAANFQTVPEPASLVLFGSAAAMLGSRRLRRRRKA